MHTRRSFSLVVVMAALVMCLVITVTYFSTTAVAVDPAVTPQDTFEYDTNRPGSDYKSFDIQADPAICRNECTKDGNCRAFTYVKPGVQGQYAKCWLKNSVPGAAAHNCCVSGVKRGDAAVTPQEGFEYDTNRYGGDYKGFEIQADPAICRNECAKDPNCRAFSYVKPGHQGTNAQCWLKNSIPRASANNCCVSGVKREATVTGGGDARQLDGTWNFVCCGGQYNGGLHFKSEGGNSFTGYMYHADHTIAGQINGNTVTFKRTFSGGSWNVTLTLSSDGRTLTGGFTGDAPANLPRDIRATR